MRLLASQNKITSTFNELLEKCQGVSFAVAWASCEFDSCKQLFKLREKIRQGVVGTHFYQTDPEFIERFVGEKKVKFIRNQSGVFHPKIYLFDEPDGEWSCLIGSANFTRGGFGDNSELLVHIEKRDDTTDALGVKIRRQIQSYYDRSTAKFADDINLDDYRYWKDRFKRLHDKSEGQFGTKKAKKTLDEIELLNMNWTKFFAEVRKEEIVEKIFSLEKRTEVLIVARTLFEKHGSLEKMSREERQGVSGFAQLKEGEPVWGCFGSMFGAGIFKNLINENPAKLSAALDEIPLNGPVQREDYEAFVDKFKGAFPQKNGVPTRHGLATATRLLALKRPDYFVCLDKANRSGLSKAFGITINHHDYDDYWDSIIERIFESKWWNCRRPAQKQAGQVWDGRAAFLDAIYYEPL